MGRYDVAIIGTGPAGLSAAINAKVRNKNFILFGNSNLSEKVSKAHTINNYLGLFGKTGQEISKAFKNHIESLNIEIKDEKITTVYKIGDYFSLLSKKNEMYEASTVILATGVNFGKPFDGEKELLGKGVSYCATCDAMLYRGKVTAVIGYNENDEEEAKFLAQVAEKVYYIPVYKEDVQIENDNIEIIRDSVVSIKGNKNVEKLILKNNELKLDGVFILRESVFAEQLVHGLKVENSHIVVDRSMKTNIEGCFAAGDVVGKPYQYIKAAGEGNIAALSAVSYLDINNKS